MHDQALWQDVCVSCLNTLNFAFLKVFSVSLTKKFLHFLLNFHFLGEGAFPLPYKQEKHISFNNFSWNYEFFASDSSLHLSLACASFRSCFALMTSSQGFLFKKLLFFYVFFIFPFERIEMYKHFKHHLHIKRSVSPYFNVDPVLSPNEKFFLQQNHFFHLLQSAFS